MTTDPLERREAIRAALAADPARARRAERNAARLRSRPWHQAWASTRAHTPSEQLADFEATEARIEAEQERRRR